MKRAPILLLVALVISSSIYAQQSKPEDALISLEKQSWEAWQMRDGKFFQGFLLDDHVEVGQSGLADKAAVVAFVGSPICKVESYKIDKFKVVFFDPNFAVVNYYAEQDTTCNGVKVPSPAWASSGYIRRNGRWLNALYQQTPIVK